MSGCKWTTHAPLVDGGGMIVVEATWDGPEMDAMTPAARERIRHAAEVLTTAIQGAMR